MANDVKTAMVHDAHNDASSNDGGGHDDPMPDTFATAPVATVHVQKSKDVDDFDFNAHIASIHDRIDATQKAIINVPHKRCETCKHWSRRNPRAAVGECRNYINMSAHAPTTTDITVCSLWIDART